mmetsp:Transcript_123019/g.292479  ORF Transcript_123019/g.292479 Transcript_123019/m.292479 type:complete len:222 (+) Transcript_123019:502-1167(+)
MLGVGDVFPNPLARQIFHLLLDQPVHTVQGAQSVLILLLTLPPFLLAVFRQLSCGIQGQFSLCLLLLDPKRVLLHGLKELIQLLTLPAPLHRVIVELVNPFPNPPQLPATSAPVRRPPGLLLQRQRLNQLTQATLQGGRLVAQRCQVSCAFRVRGAGIVCQALKTGQSLLQLRIHGFAFCHLCCEVLQLDRALALGGNHRRLCSGCAEKQHSPERHGTQSC